MKEGESYKLFNHLTKSRVLYVLSMLEPYQNTTQSRILWGYDNRAQKDHLDKLRKEGLIIAFSELSNKKGKRELMKYALNPQSERAMEIKRMFRKLKELEERGIK